MCHAKYVRAIACSPDGKYVLSCAGYLDNTALLWTKEGRLVKILEGHHSDLWDAEFSADGWHMLTLETGTWTAHLWNNEGLELAAFHEIGLSDVCFMPDNQHFLAGDWGGNMSIYDFKGQAVQEFSGGEAGLNAVAVSRDGRFLASGDTAGIIRIFAGDGTLLQTLDGHGGKEVLVLSFSPDGKRLLSGGDDQMAILWNVADGRIVQKMGPHETLVRSAVFSPDGQYIATAGPDADDARLWTAQGKLVRKLSLGDVNEILFTPDSRSLLVGPPDKAALLYDLEGKLLRTYTNSSSPVTTVGFSPFSPDSLFIVTGGEGIHVRLWDVVTGEAEGFPEQVNLNAPIAFNPELPMALIGQTDDSLYQYDLYTEEQYTIEKPGYSSTAALAYSHDGAYFLTANYTGGVQLYREEDGEMLWNKRLPSNFANSLDFSPDGRSFLVALFRDYVPILASAVEPGAPEQPYNGAGFPAYLRGTDNFSVIRTFGTSADKAVFSPDGKYVATNEKYELSLYNSQTGKEIFHAGGTQEQGMFVFCLAFSPDSRSVVAGYSDNVSREYDLTGKLIREYHGHLSAVRSVGFSPFGEYLITGSSDNTAKIWNSDNGEEIVSLMAVGNDDWLVITPDGLFDASPGAMHQLYFTAGLEIIELDQLKELYYEPGLLAEVMGFAEGKLREVQDLDAQELKLYPLLVEATVTGDKINVRLQKRNGGIGDAVVLLDGDLELIPDANPRRLESFQIDLAPYAEYFIPGEVNKLALVFYNADGWLPSPDYIIDYTPGKGGVLRKDGPLEKGKDKDKPNTNAPAPNDKSDQAITNTLYALVVGTSDYAGTELDLRFPDQDAKAYKEVLELAGAALFGARMDVRLLTTSPGGVRPTKQAIQAALRDIAAKAEPKDILMVYFSGHGTTWPENSADGQFYYLTAENSSFNFDDAKNRSYAIGQDTLQAWMHGVTARKRILILDACNSGEVVKKLENGAKGNLNSDQRRALQRMKDRGGFFVLAGSAADKSSYEDPRFGHGLLTYSLLRNMPKVAAIDKDRFVDVGKLFTEVREDVPKLAGELKKVQEPKLIGMEDYSIGIIKDGSAVKLPSAKKIVTKSSFSNKKRLDPLKLTDAINDELEKLLADPTLPFAYWPVDKAAGLYHFMNGEYEVTGTAVKVTAYFYKSDQDDELKTFTATGTSDKVKSIVENLTGQLAEYLGEMK